VLILELLFDGALRKLGSTFCNSIELSTAGGLKSGLDAEQCKHLQQANIDVKDTAALALTDEQELLGVQEKIEFAIKMGNKLMRWLDDLDPRSQPEGNRDQFNTAGDIIRNRIQYLVDGLDFHTLRLRRAQGQSQLNRLGVSTLRVIEEGSSNDLSLMEETPAWEMSSVTISRERVNGIRLL
jgi:hypothetical protein